MSPPCAPAARHAFRASPVRPLSCSGDELDGELLAEVEQDDAVAKSQ